MLSKVFSGSVYGIDGYLVTVEVDIAAGLPKLCTVGLPDTAVREARDRVVSAVRNSGFDFPVRKIIVNLAPADIRKEGAAFDLPIAVGVLAASDAVRKDRIPDWCFVGELALDGALRPVKGILAVAMEMQMHGLKGMVVPEANVAEAAVVQGIKVLGVKNLKEVANFLNAETPASLQARETVSCPWVPFRRNGHDFSDIKGQTFAKRALEIASAGAHNVLMIGPPGSGKTMLSQSIPSILPPLTLEEALETTKIHSVAGLLPRPAGLLSDRPFRNPHHTISHVALIGGVPAPKPGEASLAHNGVLFLDELPEFHRNALEVLRQPLESREIVVARAKGTLTFPANFMLVAAMNPCPCGFFGHPIRECICTPRQVQKYMAKISGPLLDRFDIHLEVPALGVEELLQEAASGERSQDILERVLKARLSQRERLSGLHANGAPSPVVYSNAHMTGRQTRKFCALDKEGKALMRSAMEKLGFSARAHDRILKVARTIADLQGDPAIRPCHLSEAIQYRALDRAKR